MNSKTQHTVQFQLFDILEKTNIWRQKKRSVVPQEWGRDWGEMNKQNTENF